MCTPAGLVLGQRASVLAVRGGRGVGCSWGVCEGRSVRAACGLQEALTFLLWLLDLQGPPALTALPSQQAAPLLGRRLPSL